jgi:hypothetical protein
MLARVALEEAGFVMPRTRAAVRTTVAMAAVAALVGCGTSEDISTVADFDDHPCGLVSTDIMTGIIAQPYHDAAQGTPVLSGEKESDESGTTACTYSYKAPDAAVPQLGTFTVTIAHTEAGNRPLAICSAGATSRTAGYTVPDHIGDDACLSPTADLWMRVGQHYYHVVVGPQPGFSNPVDRLQALAPMILAVARSAADRLPRT